MGMKKLLFIFPLFFMVQVFGQVAVNVLNGPSTMTVNGSLQTPYKSINGSYTLTVNDYYVAYTGTGNATVTLPAVGSSTSTSFAGRIYHIKNFSSGTVTLSPSGGNTLRFSNLPGVSSFSIPAGRFVTVMNNSNTSGSTWDIVFKGNADNSAVVKTRFLGGTIYASFNQNSYGNQNVSRVISGKYNVGTNVLNVTPTVGGIDALKGTGYQVSNPGNGFYDIQFTTPFKNIYGVSALLVDAYGDGSPSFALGEDPKPTQAGSRLNTKDNTMITFLSNSLIRIKTGDNNGKTSNRPITFLVIGE